MCFSSNLKLVASWNKNGRVKKMWTQHIRLKRYWEIRFRLPCITFSLTVVYQVAIATLEIGLLISIKLWLRVARKQLSLWDKNCCCWNCSFNKMESYEMGSYIQVSTVFLDSMWKDKKQMYLLLKNLKAFR